MIAFDKTRQTSPSRPRAGGFTLIELLAVIAILAILVSLVVAVGKRIQGIAHRDETLLTMQVLVAGMDAYKDSYTEYPPDHDSGWTNAVPPTGTTNATLLPGDGIGVLWMYLTGRHYAGNTCTGAVTDLSAQACVQAAKPKLDKLPPGAAMSPPAPGFKDAFGAMMRYQLVGGKPLLLSAGPDSTFGSSDDIRSDGH